MIRNVDIDLGFVISLDLKLKKKEAVLAGSCAGLKPLRRLFTDLMIFQVSTERISPEQRVHRIWAISNSPFKHAFTARLFTVQVL